VGQIAHWWVIFLVGCSQRTATVRKEPPPLVRTVQAVQAPMPGTHAPATVVPRARLRLGFKFAERVESVEVTRGQKVSKGQLLARAEETTSRLDLRAAKVELGRAQRELRQARKLKASGAITPNSLEDAQVATALARTNLIQRQDRLQQTKLRSPVDGVVYEAIAQPGEIVAPGAPVVVVDEVERRLRFAVTDLGLGSIEVGRTLDVNRGEQRLTATVSSFAQGADAELGLYLVEAAFDSAAAQELPLGCTVEVGVEEDAVLGTKIPFDALLRRNDRTGAFVLRGVVHAREVEWREIGASHPSGRDVIIDNGVLAGEFVISEGGYFLRDGQAVRVAEEGPGG
jgi:RND family efflux transporter MFP subunit